MEKTTSVSELRNNLCGYVNWVAREHKPLFLTRNGQRRFMLLDLESYEALRNTARGNPLNEEERKVLESLGLL